MWVARDKSGTLIFSPDKLKRDKIEELWWSDNYIWLQNDILFPNLKWEDEPLEVQLVEVKSNDLP